MSRMILTYQIRLEQPLLLTGLEGDPNSSVSHDFIPGSALRGLFISRYGLTGDNDIEDRKNMLAKQLFFSEKNVLFLNAYLAVRTKKHEPEKISTPVPLSWLKKKYPDDLNPNQSSCDDSVQEIDEIYDMLLYDEDDENDEDKPDKSIGGWWLKRGDDTVQLASPKRRIAVHTTRNRKYGRSKGSEAGPSEIQGAVFRYESLAARQTFHAQIVYDTDYSETIEPWFDDEFASYLGGARTAGYGRVCIKFLGKSEYNPPSPYDDDQITRTVTMTLLSDLLLRDEMGQWSADPTQVAVALGLDREHLKNAYVKIRPIGGFNRKWGLPLTQKYAFQAGSVFAFEIPVISMPNIPRLLDQGLGYQRNEGFGRVLFDQHQHDMLSQKKRPQQPDPESITLTDTKDIDVAQHILRRLMEVELEQFVMKESKQIYDNSNRNGMSRTQIGRLRQMVQNGIRMGKFDADALAKDINSRSKSKREYERPRINGQKLLVWLDKLIKATQFDKQTSNLNKVPSIGGVEPSISSELIQKTHLQIVDAVLKRMQKEAQDE